MNKNITQKTNFKTKSPVNFCLIPLIFKDSNNDQVMTKNRDLVPRIFGNYTNLIHLICTYT